MPSVQTDLSRRFCGIKSTLLTHSRWNQKPRADQKAKLGSQHAPKATGLAVRGVRKRDIALLLGKTSGFFFFFPHHFGKASAPFFRGRAEFHIVTNAKLEWQHADLLLIPRHVSSLFPFGSNTIYLQSISRGKKNPIAPLLQQDDVRGFAFVFYSLHWKKE